MNEGESVVADLWNRKLVLVGEKEERRCRGVFRCGELHGVYGYVAIVYSFVLNSDWWYFRSKILQSYFNVLACKCFCGTEFVVHKMFLLILLVLHISSSMSNPTLIYEINTPIFR
jgi:hypothetical protein